MIRGQETITLMTLITLYVILYQIIYLMPFRRGHYYAMNIDANQIDASQIDATIILIINTIFHVSMI